MGSPLALRPSPPMVPSSGSPRAAGAWSYDDLWLCCPLRWLSRRGDGVSCCPTAAAALFVALARPICAPVAAASPHAAGEPGWRERLSAVLCGSDEATRHCSHCSRASAEAVLLRRKCAVTKDAARAMKRRRAVAPPQEALTRGRSRRRLRPRARAPHQNTRRWVPAEQQTLTPRVIPPPRPQRKRTPPHCHQ